MKPTRGRGSVGIFRQWLQEQDYQVIRTDSSYWYNAGPRVYQAVPSHWIIEPSEEELAELWFGAKALALRYSTPLQAPQGYISYHAVYENPTYDFDNLGKWARKNVRRGLRHCQIEPISFEYLAQTGWQLQWDTLNRQGRFQALSQPAWRRLCLAAAALPGFEAWGALVQGGLSASVITFQMGDCCYLLYQQCHRDFLAAHVNNALAFVVTQTMIRRPGISSIFYGLHSLDAPASVDEFKFRMGYRAKPVRQRVVFHPWLQPLIGKAAHTLVKKLHARCRGNAFLSKTEGMLHFYLESRKPLREQEWPEVLADLKVGSNEPCNSQALEGSATSIPTEG